ncbi:MAG: magnesium/cobalt transporter CorA [Candidatus Latescibacteria bacterium]|nr:magnesium/cobalt transporter CorA [Candidatus Latescibacterota bacterium]
MITIYCYNIAEGTMETPALEELPVIYESGNVDIWVDLEAPTPREAEILSTVFDFHELAIEDCTALDIEEAKLDDFEDHLFMVFHSVDFDRNDLTFDFIELDLFFGRNFVVTYHKKPTPGVKMLKQRLHRDIDFMGHGSDEILHAIVDSLVDNYIVIFKDIEKAILKIESEILSNPSKDTFNDLFRLKRGLIDLKRIVIPEEEVLDLLGNSEHELIQEENKVYFQDIHDHVSTIEGRLLASMEMVTGTMDMYVSISQHRMNSIMQTLTVIATIVLIPTLVSSIYGMNFKNMPLLESEHGFSFIMSICLVVIVAMLWFFKKQDWF